MTKVQISMCARSRGGAYAATIVVREGLFLWGEGGEDEKYREHPPEPMARPTSAWARAGESLTPSPTIATGVPPACSTLTASAFPPGSTCTGPHAASAGAGNLTRSYSGWLLDERAV